MMGPASLFTPTVDLYDVLPGMFYEDDIHPEIQMPGAANSAIHLEHHQKKKKEKLSAPGDKQYNRWCWYKLVM